MGLKALLDNELCHFCDLRDFPATLYNLDEISPFLTGK